MDHTLPERGAPSVPAPAHARTMPPEIVLDLSRLLSRLRHPTPTGVDRVEFAYARTLLRRVPGRLAFGALHPTGMYGRLPTAAVERFLDETEQRWEFDGGFETETQRLAFAATQAWALRARPVPPPPGQRVLLQASPHHLDRHGRVIGKLGREAARFVCLLHDLIPVTHPEFARPGGSEEHARRLDTLRRLADAILVNSQATAAALSAWAGADAVLPPVRVAPLGCNVAGGTEGNTRFTGTCYFLCLGTIEPRKNHLLLLNLWRSLVEAIGPKATPRLILVGRRGWENENILDMLDRCPALHGVVVELDRLPDTGLRPLLRDACALLMPSFAEGFGLPIAEALAAGVPVLASDLPAHREVGGAVPEYLDPIDGAGWRTAVLDYAARSSARRKAQLDRLSQWHAGCWDRHIDIVLDVVAEVAAC